MASYRIENGRLVDSTTGLPPPPSNDIIATPKPIYETRLKTQEYQEFANKKAEEFQKRFYSEQEQRKGSFQKEAALKQRYYSAKESAKRQLEVGSDAAIMGRIQKNRETFFTNTQQKQVEDFNKQTEFLFETGKKQTQKEIDEARSQFEYRVQVGSYTELSKYDGGKREIIGYSYKSPKEISEEIQANIKKQEEQFKIDWESQGGVYADYSGNIISSALAPSKIGAGYVKIGTGKETDQSVLAARAADIKNQIEAQKQTWANTGGTYINPFGNLISSGLTPSQLNVGKYAPTESNTIDLLKGSLWTKFQTESFAPFAPFVTKDKPFVGGFVKIANPNETDFSLIQSRAQPIIEEARVGYTMSYINALANPQYAPLTPEEIAYNKEVEAYNNQVLSPKEILAQRKPIDQWIPDAAASGARVQKETYDFLVNEPFLDKYVWGKVKSIPYLISGVAGTGEFVKSLGGEGFRNYVLQLKASPASVGAVPIGMRNEPIYNQSFTRQQIEITYQSSYTTGRLLTGIGGYFTPAAPAFAAFDIAQARTPMEVIEPLILVGGTTALLKGGFKVAQYIPLKASALLGGEITKAGTILTYSQKIPQYLEYGSKIGQYAAPVALAGYSAYGLYQATPYLYSSDKLVAREAERRLFVSLGAGYVGGLGGDYLGTELFEKNLNWRIGRETALQGGSTLGKLTPEQKISVEAVYKRAYGKELPGDVSTLIPVKEYTSANLDIFTKFNKSQQKALTRITDQTIKDFSGELYIGGSSQVPTQITTKAFKKAGDIDVFLGTKEFAVKLTENINAARIPGVKAKATYGDDLMFEGAAHVSLYKNGKALIKGYERGKPDYYEFVNIHYDLSRTTQQLKLFGEPFQTTKGAFISTPSGTRVFNIREQLRAKIEGYYFGSRAKDLVDIEGILKGTEKIASSYKIAKTKSVWLDERAMFNPTNVEKSLSFSFSGYGGKAIKEAYSPYTNYSVPEYAQIKVPAYGKDYYKPSKKDSYYSTAYSDYKPSYYAPSYSPAYSTKYSPSYNATYSPTYSQSYTPKYSPSYAPNYSPKYSPGYTPKYSPNYAPVYAPKYTPKYTPKYSPKYTPKYTPPWKPKNPPVYRSKERSESKEAKQFRKAMTRGETILFKPGNIENLILPIKTDWLKAIGYSKKKPKIQTIKLLPSERKGSKQISRLLGYNFDKLF